MNCGGIGSRSQACCAGQATRPAHVKRNTIEYGFELLTEAGEPPARPYRQLG